MQLVSTFNVRKPLISAKFLPFDDYKQPGIIVHTEDRVPFVYL
jgi:hypothetical protein